MDGYHQPTTRRGEGGTCDDAGGIEQQGGTVVLITDIMNGIMSNMDWSLLENAICVLNLAKEQGRDPDNRAAIQCARIKAYLTRFCCLGWVESLVVEGSVPTELMFTRWANPWIWANPESVEFALEVISSLRQLIDRGRLDTAICVGYTTLEYGEPKDSDGRGIRAMLGKALVMRYIHGGLPADLDEGGARLRDVAQMTGLGSPWVYICALSLRNVAWLRGTETRNFEASRELGEWRAVAEQEEKEGRDSFIHGTEMLERGELHEAVPLLRLSLRHRATPHPLRDATLNNLGNALHMQFGKGGDTGDLEESLYLQPAPHPNRSMGLSNLAQYDLQKATGDLKYRTCAKGRMR